MRAKTIGYIHTLNGNPASYEKGRQICFGTYWHGIEIVPSLRQIRREQKTSKEWRESEGMSEDGFKCDYIRVVE